ncbi:MAG: glycosyltransferase [Candidatus Aceula meridiana]|nr:glycosyltransferase [Candidatus Aceula meridiana]
MEINVFVSVVIPTKNSSEHLDKVLLSVRNQTYRNIEIIVVDNDSVDDTREIAAKHTDKIYTQGSERSSQKNFGAKIAKGEYIFFLDSDAEPSEEVVWECAKLIQKGYDMVIIPEKHLGSNFWARAKALERECFLNDDTIEAPWFFKRDSFFSVGGYDEEMFAGEDWDLFERMKEKGYQFTRNQSFIRHHLGHLKFWKAIRKKYYYGKNLGVFIEKNKKSFSRRIPFLRPAYIRNWRLLIRHPFLTIGFLLLKAAESFFILLGIIKYKLQK